LDQGIQPVGAARGGDHVEPVGRQRAGGGRPDPAGGPGHDSDSRRHAPILPDRFGSATLGYAYESSYVLGKMERARRVDRFGPGVTAPRTYGSECGTSGFAAQ